MPEDMVRRCNLSFQEMKEVENSSLVRKAEEDMMQQCDYEICGKESGKFMEVVWLWRREKSILGLEKGDIFRKKEVLRKGNEAQLERRRKVDFWQTKLVRNIQQLREEKDTY